MPFYLTKFSYTPATWEKLIKNPEDRRAAASAVHRICGRQTSRILVRLRGI